ncbi:MAG: uidR [Myxococcaceae bacterium]|nr:uidR [Myxococcaceae bacterium]
MPRRTPSYKRRKIPRQSRAHATVDAILEAAAQLLSAHPERDFDTNKLAEHAGVSVGTLYQYFPNKGAVLRALIERQASRKLDGLQSLLQALGASSLAQQVEQAIDFIIDSKRENLRLEQALYLHFHRFGDPAAIAALESPALTALSRITGGRPLRSFVLLHAVRAALLAASVDHPESLTDGSLRAELVTLATGCLRDRDESSTYSPHEREPLTTLDRRSTNEGGSTRH